MKTQQEIFDTVAVHLLTQKAVSKLANSDTCAYRGANGLKCAVGVLIADEHYYEELEGKSSQAFAIQAVLRKSGINAVDNDFLLSALQRVHDSYSPGEWFQALHDVAGRYRLSPKALYPFAPAP